MAFTSNIRLLTPLMRSMVVSGSRTCAPRPLNAAVSNSARLSVCNTSAQHHQLYQTRPMSSDVRQTFSRAPGQVHDDDKPQSLGQILESEIQEEMQELNQRLSSDQFPGFSVETDGSDVKLTKQIGDAKVIVRFTVSSSLSEWRTEPAEQQQQQQQQSAEDQEEESYNFSLLSLPEFQVQIVRDGKTLEASCYFEEMDQEGGMDESGESFPADPLFQIDEIVMYEGEPRETEFAVSTEYFREELQEGLLNYMAEHGIDDEFAKNLVSFATNYEKKQYIGLMKRLKEFVSK